VLSPADTSRRVLLVEDDVSNSLTLSALLGDIGCVVDTAVSLAEARAALATARYAVVLLDYHLTDGLGTALLPLLRGAQPAMPAVLLSGSAETVLGESDGFAATHIKGGDPEELLDTVRRLTAR
jgi:DNA-binding NtrC family response regulator